MAVPRPMNKRQAPRALTGGFPGRGGIRGIVPGKPY
jgi:hypothetical protein